LTFVVLILYYVGTAPFDVVTVLVWVLVTPLVAIYPDIDTEFGKHRAAFHNIYIPVVVTIVFSLAGLVVVVFPLWVGYLSHIALDMSSKVGVKIFWPFSKRAIGGTGKVAPKSFLGHFVTMVVSIVLGLLISFVGASYYYLLGY